MIPSTTASALHQDDDTDVANIFDVNQSTDAQFSQRLIEILAAHKASFIDVDDQQDIVAFMNGFHSSYSLLHFQNDFDNYLATCSKDALFAESFYYRMLHKLNGQPCFISHCCSAARNGRTCTVRQKMTDSESIHHQLIDSVHVFCLHMFDRYQLLQQEKDAISADEKEGALARRVRQKAESYDKQIRIS